MLTNIYFVTGWTVVPGDCAYVEAESDELAKDALRAELERRNDTHDLDLPPRSGWTATQMTRPVCLIVYRD